MVPQIRASGPITSAVVTAIADAKEIDASELDIVLQDHIDVDALESLTAHESGTWSLTFELPEHTVTVTDDNVVYIDEPSEEV